jgi:hypothetical protein
MRAMLSGSATNAISTIRPSTTTKSNTTRTVPPGAKTSPGAQLSDAEIDAALDHAEPPVG